MQVKGQASTMGWSWNSSPLDNGSTGCQHAWAHLWPCRRRWLPQGEHFQSDFSRLRKTLMIPWRRENGGASSSRPSSRSSWASSASSLSEPLPPSFAGRSVPKSKINDKTKKEKTKYIWRTKKKAEAFWRNIGNHFLMIKIPLPFLDHCWSKVDTVMSILLWENSQRWGIPERCFGHLMALQLYTICWVVAVLRIPCSWWKDV